MKFSESELHAYVDDQLPAGRRTALEALLTQSPDEWTRVVVYRQQNAALRTAFGPVLDESVPERLRQIEPRKRYGTRLAIAASWLVIGGAIGWLAHAWIGPRVALQTLPHEAAIAHAVYSPEVRHPVEVGANEQEHLVNWLSKRLGARLNAPLLVAQGYELVGGRLLPGESGAVAQFMYQDAKGRRLTLYVSRLPGRQRDTAFRFSQEDRVAVFYWIDGSLGYALSGELPKAELLEIATVVYRQINP